MIEQLRPIQIESVQAHRDGAYLRALHSPTDILIAAAQQEHPRGLLPMQVSELRGSMPVLSHNGNVDAESIAVIANCGALSYNSPAFVTREADPELADIIAYDRVAYGPRMLGYSLPHDMFVFESSDGKRSTTALSHIVDGYEQIGVNVTRNFVSVHSVDQWIKAQRGGTPILANAYDPLLLANFGRTFAEKSTLFRNGLVNAAAYTKDGVTSYWEQQGVPVPPTLYYELNEENIASVTEAIKTTLGSQGYERAVVSTFDGAGGDGVRFLHLNALDEGLTGRFRQGNIQVQGLLPLEESPCVVANITKNGIDILLVSKQRFSAPGSHGGNVWEGDEKTLQEMPADFVTVNNHALKALQQAGVFGQVNLDALVISEQAKRQFGLPATTLMREANIRPAGSSVILRMKQGSIDGMPIRQVRTTGIKIPFAEIEHSHFLEKLNMYRQPGVAVMMYSYDIQSDKASVAFVAGEGIPASVLDEVEQQTMMALKKGIQ